MGLFEEEKELARLGLAEAKKARENSEAMLGEMIRIRKALDRIVAALPVETGEL
jgi:hypothetical protein